MRSSPVVLALCVMLPSGALAADPARAQALFDEASRLMEAREYAKACPKLEESMRAERAPGTLLRLALCHELAGQLASAWAEYLEGLAWAQRDAREDRVLFATSHLRSLQTRLSFLTVSAPPRVASLRGLTLYLNDTALGIASLNTASPVNPGTYELRAEAPGYEPGRATLRVDREGLRYTLAVPALRKARPVLPPDRRREEALGETKRRTTRSVGLAVGAGGVTMAAVGGYLGLQAIGAQNDAERLCPNSPCADRRAGDGSRSAVRLAWSADVALALGGIATAVGAYLWISNRPLKVAASLGPEHGVLSAEQAF